MQIKIARAAAFQRTLRCAQPADTLATPEIPESTGKVARAGIKYLSNLIQQIVDLRNERPSDEYGVLQLDEQVFLHARDLLIDTAIALVSDYEGTRMPHGCASTDEEGGLRFEWLRDDAEVHLVIPIAASAQKPYLFHSRGIARAIDRNVCAESLAQSDWRLSQSVAVDGGL